MRFHKFSFLFPHYCLFDYLLQLSPFSFDINCCLSQVVWFVFSPFLTDGCNWGMLCTQNVCSKSWPSSVVIHKIFRPLSLMLPLIAAQDVLKFNWLHQFRYYIAIWISAYSVVPFLLHDRVHKQHASAGCEKALLTAKEVDEL